MITMTDPFEFIYRRTSNAILIAGTDGLIEAINPAAAAMIGIASEQVIKQRPNQCFSKFPALINLFTRRGDQTIDVRLPKKRLASGVGGDLPDGRRIVILEDVTEQRQFEARRESFVNTMAHDLRNPITAIMGYVELVATTGDLNPDQTEYLERVRQMSEKLHQISEKLVDLAWVEAGMPMRHEQIALKPLLEEVIASLTSEAKAKHIAIPQSVQDPLPNVLGDPLRIRMVIHNLLENAILYSNDHTIIFVHAWGDTNEVYLALRDQGFGIAEDELDFIFDRMYRSPSDARVQAIPGAGLGLTITRRILMRHGGNIWVQSKRDEGTTFTISLPALYATSKD